MNTASGAAKAIRAILTAIPTTSSPTDTFTRRALEIAARALEDGGEPLSAVRSYYRALGVNPEGDPQPAAR